ncbi:hypothetical protein HN385_02490 [archaeon]|jgi:hypothetical protein|nr:hypothetical protein [archaeon]MBT3450786.1 hypothetical protein [archaeon]MBT6868801.1 hypothetical protein [archaeon]MBT7192978.1 hypothetical protein [archaeon]MBT7380944.1 hypothetical protein [archaeon]
MSIQSKTISKTEQDHLLTQLLRNTPGSKDTEKEEILHSAMLLSFYAAAKKVVKTSILSAPFYSMKYDHEVNNLEFKVLGGSTTAPKKKGEYVLDGLDMIFACHNRDVPLILQGDTGKGKTITTEAYLKTILPEESVIIMSLSMDDFSDSPSDPFKTDSFGENQAGIPKRVIDWEKMRTIAAEYIDEFNLGNTNELLQLTYARIMVSRERGCAGIPVPEVTLQGANYHEKSNLKRLWVSGSQNPPKSQDEQFTGIELSASMKNRVLLLEYPGILQSVAETMWLKESLNGHHKDFLKQFCKNYQKLTGQNIDQDALKKEWLSVYAYTMDSSRTEKAIITSSLEFGGYLMLALSGNIGKLYEGEKEVVRGCSERLGSLVNNFNLSNKVDDGSQEVKNVKQILSSFNKDLTERDDRAIKDLADLIATQKALKNAYAVRRTNPSGVLQTYLNDSGYITIEDVAAATTLLARNKQRDSTNDPLNVVNSILKTYTRLVDDLADKMKIKGYTSFRTDNPNIGLKYFIYTTSLMDSKNTDEIVRKIDQGVGRLKRITTGSEFGKVIVARTVADLAVCASFLKDYESEVNQYIKESSGNEMELRGKIQSLYEQESGDDPDFDPLYEHRLTRILL